MTTLSTTETLTKYFLVLVVTISMVLGFSTLYS